MSDLIARLLKLGVEVKDVGTGTVNNDEEIAGIELPGFVATLPKSDMPAFDLSVRYHPFRRMWLLQTLPIRAGLFGHIPESMTISLLRHGAKSDAAEIVAVLGNSSPDIVYAGSVARNTGGAPLSDIIETAVVTAAIVPFVQAVAKKAGEDVYEKLKQVITAKPEGKHHRKKFFKGRGQGPEVGQHKQEALGNQGANRYIYDPVAMIFLVVPSSDPGEALRALSNVDMTAMRGRVITWSIEERSWIPVAATSTADTNKHD